jgi:predicted nucleotidyltransferase
MHYEPVIARLRDHEAELRERGVRHVALFGSRARGDVRPDSDIDILIELDPDAPVDLFRYAGIKRYIAELFVGPVDVVDCDALKPHIRRPAAHDAIYAF